MISIYFSISQISYDKFDEFISINRKKTSVEVISWAASTYSKSKAETPERCVDLFKAINKIIRTTSLMSFWCLYY